MIEFDGSKHPNLTTLTRYVGFLCERGHISINEKILPAEVEPGNAEWPTGRAVWVPVSSSDPSFRRPDDSVFLKAVKSVTPASYFQIRAIELINEPNKSHPNFPPPDLKAYQSQSWPLLSGSMIVSGSTSQSTGATPVFDKVLAEVARNGETEKPTYTPLRHGTSRQLIQPIPAKPSFFKLTRGKVAAAAAGFVLAGGASYLAYSHQKAQAPAPQGISRPLKPDAKHPKSSAPTPKMPSLRPRQNLKHHDAKPKSDARNKPRHSKNHK